ncbi:MAG: tetratricopeptide repeat protein [Bacteroidales bacterium]|nr:tetratricopeptide repeat protein [Bacteroidales bacterium]
MPLNANPQIIDSIDARIQRHKTDTSVLRVSLVELQKSSLIGSKKADSLVQVILYQSQFNKFSCGIALSYHYFGLKSLKDGNYKSSSTFLKKSLTIFEKLEDSTNIIATYQSLASAYFNMGKQDSAIIFCSKVIKSYKYRNESKNLASGYNTLGGIYWSKGDFSDAAEAFFKSLDIKVKIGDSLGVANTYNNIGILYDSQQKLPEALEMYNKSYEIYKKKGSKRGISKACNNIAVVLKNLNRYGEAIEMLLRSLEIDRQLGNIDDQGITLNNIGQLYIRINEVSSSLNYFKTAREIFHNNDNLNGEAASIINIGCAYLKLGNCNFALTFFEQGLSMAKKIHSVELIKETYQHLYELYKKSGNSNLALTYYERYSNFIDSLKSIENLNKLDELKIKYESELKGTEIALLNKNNLIEKFEKERQKSIKKLFVSISGLLLLVLCLVCFAWLTIKKDNQKLLLKNTEINTQKEEIEAQRDLLEELNITLNNQNEEILDQRDQIDSKNRIIFASNRRLTENIEYASRIQKALLPDADQISQCFSKYYIVYKPKDIVSGDFYWMLRQKDKIYFSIADCTGHGVSGAFMSILAYNYLKDSIITKGLSNPKDILSFIRNEFENNLYRNKSSHDIKDGLDIIVCCYNQIDNSIEYSGAHSSFYHIRNDSLIRYKTDRYSIGSQINQTNSFTQKQLKLEAGDRIIFYTDGYMDQLNRNRKTKIGSLNFKNLLQNSGNLTINEQKQRIEKFFDDWKGDYEQIDDVLVMCIEV